jgi:hypothetical protein
MKATVKLASGGGFDLFVDDKWVGWSAGSSARAREQALAEANAAADRIVEEAIARDWQEAADTGWASGR